jgi:hypothetical protein
MNKIYKNSLIVLIIAVIIFISSFSGCCKFPERRTLEYAVATADLIVHGYIVDKQYKELGVYPESVITYMIYTLSVDQTIKGVSAPKILFKVEAAIEGISPYSGLTIFGPGLDLQKEYQLLACFKYEDSHYFTLIPGGRLYKTKSDTEVNFEDYTGRILKIMQANDMEISLPKSEWPPFPTGPFLFPWER